METYPAHLEDLILLRQAEGLYPQDNPIGPSIWSALWGYFITGLVEVFQAFNFPIA